MRNPRIAVAVCLFGLVISDGLSHAADCPNLKYEAMPFGQPQANVMRSLKSAQCEIKEGQIESGYEPPHGVLYVEPFNAPFTNGIYTTPMGLFPKLHPDAVHHVRVSCGCWKEVKLADFFFVADSTKPLFLVEKQINYPLDVQPQDAADHFTALLEKTIGVSGSNVLRVSGRYRPDISRDIQKAYITTWNDQKRGAISYLIVTADTFLSETISGIFAGHVFFPGWQQYVNAAKQIVKQEKQKTKEKLGKGDEF